MTGAASIARLYPAALTAADLGIGTALYETGAVGFAIVLWIAGIGILLGVLSVGSSVSQSASSAEVR